MIITRDKNLLIISTEDSKYIFNISEQNKLSQTDLELLCKEIIYENLDIQLNEIDVNSLGLSDLIDISELKDTIMSLEDFSNDLHTVRDATYFDVHDVINNMSESEVRNMVIRYFKHRPSVMKRFVDGKYKPPVS